MLSRSNKYTKIIAYSVFGLFGGAIIGFLAALGQLNYTKKSQRENATPIYVYGFSILLGIAGISFAYKKAEDEIKTEELGLDKIYSTKVKEGIKWIYESRWVTLDNKEYLLKTFHNKETKETISTLNDDLLIDHETSTGAEKFINKEHFKALDNLKKELKSKHAI
jgi:hypothetical protein